MRAQVHVDFAQRAAQLRLGRDKDVGGENLESFHIFSRHLSGRVQNLDCLYLVTPEDYAQDYLLVGQEHVHCVALNTEMSAGEFHFVAGVERVHKPTEKFVAPHVVAAVNRHGVGVDIVGVAHAVEARYATHHHNVAPATEQSCDGGESQPVNFLVDGEVFLDIFVGGRDISLWLIVIVVGDKVVYRVFGEETLELGVELRGQCLVV